MEKAEELQNVPKLKTSCFSVWRIKKWMKLLMKPNPSEPGCSMTPSVTLSLWTELFIENEAINLFWNQHSWGICLCLFLSTVTDSYLYLITRLLLRLSVNCCFSETIHSFSLQVLNRAVLIRDGRRWCLDVCVFQWLTGGKRGLSLNRHTPDVVEFTPRLTSLHMSYVFSPQLSQNTSKQDGEIYGAFVFTAQRSALFYDAGRIFGEKCCWEHLRAVVYEARRHMETFYSKNTQQSSQRRLISEPERLTNPSRVKSYFYNHHHSDHTQQLTVFSCLQETKLPPNIQL